MNKQITVPRTAGSFPIQISEGRYDVAFVVDVFDDGHEVAKVAVYHDGSAETVTVGPLYRNEDTRWWRDLCTEVAKAVAE